MIVLDEQIADPRIISSIQHWYKGKVIGVKEARPLTRITDDVIPVLMRQLKAPTFVTINHEDFWRKIPADPAYCVVCLKLTSKRSSEIPEVLRAVVRWPKWRTKRGRLGTVILVSDHRIAYYSANHGPIELITT
ncbi:MAG: hypothetical protein AABO41_09840 [Acidobacteriota bacterium]